MKTNFFLILFFTLVFFSVALHGAWTVKQLTDGSGSFSPAIAVSGSNVYVVWGAASSGNTGVYFKRSSDGGASWGAAKLLTNNPSNSSVYPAIAASGSNVYVAWQDDCTGAWQIYFKRSANNGVSWGTKKKLTNSYGTPGYQAIAASGSNVYVAWQDDSTLNDEICFRRSTDTGANWDAKKRLTNNAGVSERPAIAASGSNVYVAWYDDSPGNDEIYFRRSTDKGATWLAAKRLTYTGAYSMRPAIAASGSNVYMAWDDSSTGDFEIYFKKSIDSGASWGANKQLTDNSGASSHPAIAVNSANVCVAWHDDCSGTYDVYCKRSTDGGASWQANELPIYNPGFSQFPDIAVSSSKVHVAWEDDTPGNDEVFVAYSPL